MMLLSCTNNSMESQLSYMSSSMMPGEQLFLKLSEKEFISNKWFDEKTEEPIDLDDERILCKEKSAFKFGKCLAKHIKEGECFVISKVDNQIIAIKVDCELVGLK